MKVHHFSLGFLGGPVDLQRMLVALAGHYPASFENPAERTRTGSSLPESVRFEFEMKTLSGDFHVFDDGHVVLRAEREIEGSARDQDEISRAFWRMGETAETALTFLKRAVSFEKLSDLQLLTGDLVARERETGLTLFSVDSVFLGWITVDNILLEGSSSESDESGGEFLIEGQRVRFLRHRHFSVSEATDALLSWMIVWVLRSYSVTRKVSSLESAQTSILRALDSLRTHLSETNPYYWERQRGARLTENPSLRDQSLLLGTST
jgi:hypothetical protein